MSVIIFVIAATFSARYGASAVGAERKDVEQIAAIRLAIDCGSPEQATSDPVARNAASNTAPAPISERRGVGGTLPHAVIMTHLSIRAGAAASYIRERAEQAKVPLGNLEITGRTNRIGMVRIATRAGDEGSNGRRIVQFAIQHGERFP